MVASWSTKEASSEPDTELGQEPNGPAQGGSEAGEPPLLGTQFEAEDGRIDSGLTVVRGEEGEPTFITPTTLGGGQSEPAPGLAEYRFELAQEGEYWIFGRIHSPSVTANRFWIRVDEQEWILWRISTGEEWFWDDLHRGSDYSTPLVFSLNAGIHQLDVASAGDAAELDQFAVVPVGGDAPHGDVQCSPPHSVLLDGQCVRSCGSYLTVSCEVLECEGKVEVPAYDCGICCLTE